MTNSFKLSSILILILTLFCACEEENENSSTTASTKTELLSRAWKGVGTTSSTLFDITFYQDGTHQFLDGDGNIEFEGNWNWTDSKETAINWQVDDDGDASDYEVANVSVTESSLTLTTSEATFSFTAK